MEYGRLIERGVYKIITEKRGVYWRWAFKKNLGVYWRKYSMLLTGEGSDSSSSVVE